MAKIRLVQHQIPARVFTTTPDDLIALKKAGVTDKIIAAIIEKGAAGSAAGAAATTPPAQNAAGVSAASPGNVSGRLLQQGAWTDLPPEVVNFKTGGVLKCIGTADIVKGDVNGHLNGLHSKTQLKSPVELWSILRKAPRSPNTSYSVSANRRVRASFAPLQATTSMSPAAPPAT